MREIKFRAWDKLKSEMIYSGIEYELRCLSNPKYDKGYESDTIGFINNNESHFDIEQYTGLKDKNGKEIYEGDVLSHKSHFIGDVFFGSDNGVVEFDDGMYYLEEEYQIELDSASIYNYGIEILGNIHENPKLIK